MVQRILMMGMWELVELHQNLMLIYITDSPINCHFFSRNHCNHFWPSVDRQCPTIKNSDLLRFSSSSQRFIIKAHGQIRSHDRNYYTIHHIRLQRMGLEVQFCWVTSHMGVKGNEQADKLAKKK